MGLFDDVGRRLRARKGVVAAVLAIACIGVATFLVGAWMQSSQLFSPRPVAVSAQRPDSPAPPAAPKGDDMCCDMKKPNKMPMPDKMPMPGAMPMPGGTPMPGGRPMPGQTG